MVRNNILSILTAKIFPVLTNWMKYRGYKYACDATITILVNLCVQTSSEAHPASYAMGTGVLYRG
jgi:hypothetical protein